MEESSLAIAHAQIQSPYSVHGDLQSILMKSILEQQLDFSHCPKTYQWECTVPFKAERILNTHLIDLSCLVAFKRHSWRQDMNQGNEAKPTKDF